MSWGEKSVEKPLFRESGHGIHVSDPTIAGLLLIQQVVGVDMLRAEAQRLRVPDADRQHVNEQTEAAARAVFERSRGQSVCADDAERRCRAHADSCQSRVSDGAALQSGVVSPGH